MSDYYNREGQPISGSEWVRLADQSDYKIVAKADLGDLGLVSTVWLGLDHGYDNSVRIFETLVFGGALDGEMDRYATEDNARAGHNRMVARVQDEAAEFERIANMPEVQEALETLAKFEVDEDIYRRLRAERDDQS